MKVGIFDSGIGGLSVLHCAKKMLPNVDFVYYADEKHVPYGEKSPEEVKSFIKEIFEFMLDKKVDIIVIACNTATSIVDIKYREQFPVPIIGMEPAAKKAVELYGDEDKKILVAATPITVKGSKLELLLKRVDKNHKVDLIALPKLVRFAEKGEFESDEILEYLKEELKTYNIDEYGTLVLGCTHFNYFKEKFKLLFGNQIHLIDGNMGTCNQIKRIMKRISSSSGTGKIEYFFSGEKINEQDEYIKKLQRQLDKVFNIN